MTNVRKATLRKQVDKLFRENPEGSIIECVANGRVIGDYEIPINHFVTLDSKPPVHWLNLLFVFDIKDGDKVSLRIRK
jgi:hypothetical protein